MVNILWIYGGKMVEICPICKGRGKIKQEFNDIPGVVTPSTTGQTDLIVQCHGCLGLGWVSPDNPRPRPNYPDSFPVFPSYPPYSPYPYYPPNIWCNVDVYGY